MNAVGPLPDFLIIGAMKAGTTTLYYQLCRHPAVGMSREKETDFLIAEKNWGRGEDWYRQQFTPGRQIYGEASPNYTKREAFGGVPERAGELLGQARLIFIARDPVERAASQYRHALFHGVALPAPDALSGTRHIQHLIDTSCYAAQLDPWLAIFPRDRLLILPFEGLVANPGQILTTIAKFLDIADTWPGMNETGSPSAANTGSALAQTPLWAMRLSQSGLVGRLRDVMPTGLRQGIKGAMQRGPARAVPELSAANRSEIRAAVAADAARFRELAGLRFESWRVWDD